MEIPVSIWGSVILPAMRVLLFDPALTPEGPCIESRVRQFAMNKRQLWIWMSLAIFISAVAAFLAMYLAQR